MGGGRAWVLPQNPSQTPQNKFKEKIFFRYGWGYIGRGLKRGFYVLKSQFGSIGQKTYIVVWAESLGQKISTEDLYRI